MRARLEKIRSVLSAKGREYSSDTDMLHNFKVAARIDNSSPEAALWGMAKKHLVSIMDLISACERGETPSAGMVDEKLGDMINYLILLESLMIERMEGAKNANLRSGPTD